MDVSFSSSISGIQAASSNASQAAERIAKQGVTGDLVNDTIALKMSEVATKANAAVLRTINENLGTLVDIMA